jgi:NAD(P)-dependent dehydrogenase (short-subunit alcohol dehydrogenase family)
LRGGANFAAFAATKFGLRAVAQSMAREFGPQGIHVATVIVDGAIDMPAIRERFRDRIKDLPPDGLLNTDAIAETYFQLHQQQRSAWSLEVDVRPYCEKF